MTYNDPKSVADHMAVWLAAHGRHSTREVARYGRLVKGLH